MTLSGRGDAEVEFLSSWKAKKANQNKYSLNEDEEEEVGKLVREGGDLVNIMYLTSSDCIETAKLYRPSSLSEAEMDKFLSAAGGVAIPKKPRKKSRTSTTKVNEGGAGRKLVPSTSAGVQEVQSRQDPKRKGGEELDPELRETEVEEAEVRALVDKRQAKEEVLRYTRATVVKHALECEQLQKEKDELEKQNKEMRESLDEVVPAVKQLEEEKDSLSTKLVFEERKRKISKSERNAQEKEIKKMKDVVVELKKNVELLVHNAMEEHIVDFLRSGTFENIVNLYWLPTIILAFIDCRKKVKSQYPEVDVTSVTFGEQEEEMEENVEEEVAEVEDIEEGNQPPHPVEVHTIPSEENPPAQLEVGLPPLSTEEQPPPK
ncbi:hypothetical protein SLEP1_g20193 [Rubroshorea leprosula]|uniref:Uncharacterized protein n=1 Tax=Rubroshorea leprosula TaxID=152421 RepID=A0AAV5JCI6_9ROSI|nr:hypothetical protein SLEP1_g20193 [Rubroshorea leprosula]